MTPTLRRTCVALVLVSTTLAASLAATSLAATSLAATSASLAATSASLAATSPAAPGARITELSTACSASSAEVEQALDARHHDLYELWIGCGVESIAFDRSTNGGATFKAPVLLPPSVGVPSWDPALAVAPDGTLYVSYMVQRDERQYPVVEVSHDHGASFTTVTRLVPPRPGNWGDRDFIAVGPNGTVYVTWDYGPSAAEVRLLCPPGGSCSFSRGDLNIVVQKSTDGGRRFGPMVHVSPGYPTGGGDLAPLVVAPDGHVDVVYQALAVRNRVTGALGPGHLYFTSSADGGSTWGKPVRLGPGTGTASLETWWIDGDIAVDAGGTLYATWDTQGKAGDVAWLTWSQDGGRTWSQPREVLSVPDGDALVVEVAGGTAGHADVAWLGDAGRYGYRLWVRPFTTAGGGNWLGPAALASGLVHGRRGVWPGDTFGLSDVPPTAPSSPGHLVVLSWGSSVSRSDTTRDDVFATRLGLP